MDVTERPMQVNDPQKLDSVLRQLAGGQPSAPPEPVPVQLDLADLDLQRLRIPFWWAVRTLVVLGLAAVPAALIVWIILRAVEMVVLIPLGLAGAVLAK